MTAHPALQKLVAGFALPVFLLASIFCVCSSAATVEHPAERACHAHGHEGENSQQDGAKPTPHEHHADCQHCNHGWLSQAETAKVPSPAAVPWFALPTVAPHPGDLRTVDAGFRVAPFALSISPSPPPILRLKCSLLI